MREYFFGKTQVELDAEAKAAETRRQEEKLRRLKAAHGFKAEQELYKLNPDNVGVPSGPAANSTAKLFLKKTLNRVTAESIQAADEARAEKIAAAEKKSADPKKPGFFVFGGQRIFEDTRLATSCKR